MRLWAHPRHEERAHRPAFLHDYRAEEAPATPGELGGGTSMKSHEPSASAPTVSIPVSTYQLIRLRISLVCPDRRGRTVARIQK
eukprot:3852165-Prymnesium_polylepis.1